MGERRSARVGCRRTPTSRPGYRPPAPVAPAGRLSARAVAQPSAQPRSPEERLRRARQQESWAYLVEYGGRHGYPPTVREIGERVGLASPSTVHAHLANLERAGLLKRDPTKPRALELIGREKSEPAPAYEDAQVLRLPILGEIAAGGPLLAEQNI